MKKTLSILLSLLMIISTISVLPFTANALDESGKCGENVTYTFDSSTGKLTISGSGDMNDYWWDEEEASPFNGNNSINDVVIESGVTSIGIYMFYECKEIKNITIPNTVTKICQSAFESCDKIESVVIPDSVKSIDKYAFGYCSNIKYLSLGDGLNTIGEDAFIRCNKLASLTIPANVTKIEDNPFEACEGLESIQVDSMNSVFNSANNCNAIINKYTNKLVTGCKNTIIPNNVTIIGKNAFSYCTDLMKIEFPDGLKSIYEYAFYGCSNLKDVNFPDGLTTIRNNAFSFCDGIENIFIPASVIYFGEIYEENGIYITVTSPCGNSVFNYCHNIKSIEVDKNNTVFDSRDDCNAMIRTAKNELIMGCINTVIPDTIVTIQDYAFNCCRMNNIVIPVSVKTINLSAFQNCNWLTDVYYMGSKDQWNSIYIKSGNYYVTDANIHYNYIPSCDVHTPGEVTIENLDKATCFNEGSYDEVVYCLVCGKELSRETETVDALGHDFSEWQITESEIPATCKEKGKTAVETRICSRDASHIETRGGEEIAMLEHTPAEAVKENIVAATYDKAGSYDSVVYCSVCGEELSRTKVTVAKLKKTSLAKATVSGIADKTYTGKALTQSITVKLNGKTLKNGTDYKVTYKDNKNVGKATVTITGINAYSGTITKSFKINPKGTSISKLTAKSKGFTAKWAKQATQTTGYEIQYATDSKFTKNKKTITVSKNSTTSKTVSKLSAKKKYYVKIRTYKTVNGTKYYSAWSSAKSVTTKK
ncbi:MAG: fibronectin type III domain-containing protein [Eubacterium sp.]|nr:fibronectin type III domain-containing protein [Eubacterium sp.]